MFCCPIPRFHRFPLDTSPVIKLAGTCSGWSACFPPASGADEQCNFLPDRRQINFRSTTIAADQSIQILQGKVYFQNTTGWCWLLWIRWHKAMVLQWFTSNKSVSVIGCQHLMILAESDRHNSCKKDQVEEMDFHLHGKHWYEWTSQLPDFSDRNGRTSDENLITSQNGMGKSGYFYNSSSPAYRLHFANTFDSCNFTFEDDQGIIGDCFAWLALLLINCSVNWPRARD